MDESSLSYTIKEYLRFYGEESSQDRCGWKKLEECQEALASEMSIEYLFPENKRKSQWKENRCA